MPDSFALPKPQAIDDLLDQAHDLRLADTRRALALSRQAGEMALQIDYQRGLAYSLYMDSLCHYVLGGEGDMLAAALQALELLHSLGDEAGEAKACNLVGLNYHRRAEYPQALEYYHRSLTLRRTLKDRVNEAFSLNNIGLVYLQQAQYATALDYLFQSLELAESTGDPDPISYALGNLGDVYFEMDDDARALEFYQRSLELNRQTNDRAFESNALVQIGRIYVQRGAPDIAIQFLERGLALTQQTGNAEDEAQALIGLGRTYQEMHDYARADQLLARALVIMQKIGDRFMEADLYNSLGDNCRRQGDHAGALHYLTHALNVGREISSGQLLKETHRLLSDVYEQGGDYAAALSHHRAYHDTWLMLHTQETEQRIRSMDTRSELQKAHEEADVQRLKTFELSQALRALQEADAQKARLVQQLEIQAAVLDKLAREDGLTGVANRRWLDIQLAQEFERSVRFQHPLAVAMLDLDDFKQVNDRLSHPVGDRVLQTLCTMLRESSRSVDVVGRYGGEEFLLILVETSLEQAAVICERLRQSVAAYPWMLLNPGLKSMTISLGLDRRKPGDTPASLVARVDKEMYRAKHQGKNQICYPGSRDFVPTEWPHA